jgi:enoyl-CoA hydratase/carnithine racemase/thioesterase domain-containing protein
MNGVRQHNAFSKYERKEGLMDSKEIFYALQGGTMSPEDAEQALIVLLNTVDASSSIAHPSERPTRQQPSSVQPELNAIEHQAHQLANFTGTLQTKSVVALEEITSEIVQVTMQDRANKNTFSMDLIVGLIQAFQHIRASTIYKVVILTGYERYFASGGNQDGLQALQEGKVKMTDINLHSLLLDCEIPVIAALQGHAIGGGWCFGLCSDFVVMSQESTYTCNHMRYGFTPGDGATLIFPLKFGSVLAQEILFTGKAYRGADLKAKGAPIPIVPGKEVLSYAYQLARDLTEVPRPALILLKAHITEALKAQLPTVLEKEWLMQEKTFVNNTAVMQKIQATFEQSQRPHNGRILKDIPEQPQSGTVTPQPHLNGERSPSQHLPLAETEVHFTESYPELIALNQSTRGRPIIWLHGDSGGVEGYHSIAQQIARPFYGIQARGRQSDHNPLEGITTMAAYYKQIMQARQPEGPYDIGGYALGGLLAYEVTRQLQAVGQKVSTLVMLDTIDPTSQRHIVLSQRTKILQAINLALLNRLRQEPERLFQKLIRPQETPAQNTEQELLTQIIRLGRTRGLSLTKTETELTTLFQKNLHMQEAFAVEQFVVLPLPDPHTVNCSYFRNASGLFYGDFQPFFTDISDHISIDHIHYWQEWEQHIPHFQLLDLAASNHLTLLFEPAVIHTLTAFCSQLYSNENDNTQ